jgi:hypothetical protein
MAHRPHYRLLVGLPRAIPHATRPRSLRTSSRFWPVYWPGRLRAVLANRRLGPDSRCVLRLLMPYRGGGYPLADLETVGG